MDAAVIAAMAKWPNVPDCYGWLHLDAQGRWLMGEIKPGEKPSIVAHEGLKGFMNRNYVAAADGCWALQNGPQRVWVTLALAPLIARLHGGIATAHTGAVLSIHTVYLADDGVVYFDTDAGPAALESASMFEFSKGLSAHEPLHWQQSAAHASLRVKPCAAHSIETLLRFKRQAQPPR